MSQYYNRINCLYQVPGGNIHLYIEGKLRLLVGLQIKVIENEVGALLQGINLLLEAVWH